MFLDTKQISSRAVNKFELIPAIPLIRITFATCIVSQSWRKVSTNKDTF